MDKPLTKPLTKQEIIRQFKATGEVTGKVLVDPNEMIEGDLEYFLDLLSTSLVGSNLLCDVRYDAVGVQDGDVVFMESRRTRKWAPKN